MSDTPLFRSEKKHRPLPLTTGFLISFLTVVALALRLWDLGGASFWQDEVLTREIIAPGWNGLIWRGASISSTPPLYYAIERLFFLLSPTEWSLRLPSAIFGALTVPLLFRLASLLTDRQTGVVAALLLTFSPFHLWYSQDARPYTLFMLLTLASTLSLLHLLKAPDKKQWFLYWLSITLGIHTHLMTALILIFHLALVPFVTGKTGYGAVWYASRIIGCQLAASLTFFPFVPVLLKGLGVSYGIERPFSLLALPYSLFAFFSGFSLGPSTYSLHHFSPARAITPFPFVFLFFGLIFIPCLAMALRSLSRRQTRIVLLLWLVIPTTLLTLLAVNTHHSYNLRYISSLLFPLLILCAAGITAGHGRGILLLAAVLSYQATAIANHFTDPAYAKTDFRSAAAYIAENGSAGDAVYVTGHIKPFLHYFRPTAMEVVEQGAVRQDYETVGGKLMKTAGKHRRIWLVETRWEQYDPHGYAAKYCRLHFTGCPRFRPPEISRVKISCWLIPRNQPAEHDPGRE